MQFQSFISRLHRLHTEWKSNCGVLIVHTSWLLQVTKYLSQNIQHMYFGGCHHCHCYYIKLALSVRLSIAIGAWVYLTNPWKYSRMYDECFAYCHKAVNIIQPLMNYAIAMA